MFKKKKMKLSEINTLANVIGEFNKSAQEEGVDAKLGYKMARFLMKLSSPLEAYEKQRQALFKKFGEEKDGQIIVKKEKLEDFTKEIEKLLEVQETVEVLSKKIKIEEFGELKLKPSFLLGFTDYLEE